MARRGSNPQPRLYQLTLGRSSWCRSVPLSTETFGLGSVGSIKSGVIHHSSWDEPWDRTKRADGLLAANSLRPLVEGSRNATFSQAMVGELLGQPVEKPDRPCR